MKKSNSEPKVLVVVQARLGSTRFPNKVLSEISGRPALQVLLERVRQSEEATDIVLAIPDNPENDRLENFASDLELKCFRGSESDVLDRFYRAAKEFAPHLVVRITGDCPFTCSEVIDNTIRLCTLDNLDYASTDESFPDGLDVEVCKFEVLENAWSEAVDPYDR